MKKNTNNKEPKTYLGKLRLEPEFQKHYQKARLRLDIALQIARYRQAKGITQKELAKQIDSNQAVVSRIETGQENLSLDKLARIAHALGLKVELKFS